MPETSRIHDVQQQVVLITGATGGIGRATALAYAQRGASLVLLGRSPGLLEDLVTACERRGAKAVFWAGDVGEADDVRAVVALAVERFGRVDVVVHSAAVVAYGRLNQVPEAVWDKVIQTGVQGTANVAREALTAFEQAGRGHLVVIGSLLGQIAVPLMSSYVTSKWAVHGLVRVLQLEARSTPGIHISMVTPGGIDTPIYGLAATYAGRPGQPPPPVLSPEAVARRVLRVVDRNQREADAGPFNWIVRLGFSLAPRVYDTLVVPLFSRLGMGREHREPNEGNVFRPSEEFPERLS